MILTVTLSKPSSTCMQLLGKPYIRIKIKPAGTGTEHTYFAEFFTAKQVFHQRFTEQELSAFIKTHAGSTFLNCVYRTDTEEVTILGNKKGHITRLNRPLQGQQTEPNTTGINRIKNHILQEGVPVPFLVYLGIMAPDGKVVAAKYDKFRQINRFLEYIEDILPDVVSAVKQESCQQGTELRPLRLVDFGCGKSYLTFAVYYYLTEIKKIAVSITGLDLKSDVISYCNSLANQFGYTDLQFAEGDIAGYNSDQTPDIIITLHACDTATDYALGYAVRQKAKAILTVPCCQHELNRQIDTEKNAIAESSPSFETLLRYGIIKERFAALATDALRAEYLEQSGYSVQVLEFIDMAHTPKNLLIRAVLKKQESGTPNKAAAARAQKLTDSLHVSPTLRGLLQD